VWLRLRQIALVARQLEPVVDDLRAVLGLEVCYRDPGVADFGLENALLPVGDQFLEVVAPIREGTAGGRYLERRGGDGGYMVITQCDDHERRRQRVEELGIRLAHEFEVPGAFRNMQLHPKDTGGSFFEIDEQLGDGAHDVDGPWEPAGGTAWREARRTDVVSGIAGAELQADDPDGLAARCAEIAELPVNRDDQGRPVVPLDGASLRFVEATDGRGEGLGGIDLRVADRAALLASAKARGLPHDDDQVLLAGMRMYLR
jgi:Glyoxalase-like domain